jgi:hypothetical protein
MTRRGLFSFIAAAASAPAAVPVANTGDTIAFSFNPVGMEHHLVFPTATWREATPKTLIAAKPGLRIMLHSLSPLRYSYVHLPPEHEALNER